MTSRRPKRRRRRAGLLLMGVGAFAFFPLSYFGIPLLVPITYEITDAVTSAIEEVRVAAEQESKHLETPPSVRALYMSQCVVGTPSFRDELVRLIEETELNAVVIDIKDYTGKIAFPSSDPSIAPYVSDQCGAADMEIFIEELHQKDIYVIGRITVFQDPLYSERHPELAVKRADRTTVWRDHKGLSFIDVGAKPFWDYIVALSLASYELGFDELNFDYIRYPSDGDMEDIAFTHSEGFTKPEMLEEFFVHLDRNLESSGVVTSADIFGMTTSAWSDLNIGQVFERVLPYFDYVAPMVYPSHYPDTWSGFPNPDDYPYEVIKLSMGSAIERAVATTTRMKTRDGQPVYARVARQGAATTTVERVFSGLYTKPSFGKEKLRPWIQDFDYGGDYGAEEVRAQIQAVYDLGLDSWMLWAPSNRYTRGALLPN